VRSILFARLFVLALAAGFASPVSAAPPTWDHILVVIEENKSITEVIGSGEAPYIDSLAAGGVSLTNMYGLTHPSQPNYLQFFSGSNQGVTSNNDTSGITPFNTPNLGAALIAGGKSFTGYSESMPTAGYTGFDADGGLYARRHNPWVQWQAADAPNNNHLAPATNQPFTSLPNSFADLPAVSIVVPNNQHNMHDGTILGGDAWLQQNLGAYATWAQSNNSLLVVTFDEDNSAGRNRIPTVLYGADVRQGVQLDSTWTSHNLLRTVEDANGVGHSGSAAQVHSIVGAFTGDPALQTVRFQQAASNVSGYHGTVDTYIEQGSPNASHGGDTTLVVDGDGPATGIDPQQGLIRFDAIFGNGGGLVPLGATILSAKLSILTGDASNDLSGNNISLHAMLVPWSDASTWNSLTSGVTVGTEASGAAGFTLLPNVLGDYAIFDVTDSIQAMSNGAANLGWLLQYTGPDGWRYRSAEFGTLLDRPVLEITYQVPEPSGFVLAALGLVALVVWRRKR
jgi:hypothetical protein